MPDAELVKRAIRGRGDPQAFHALVDRYAGELYGIAMSLVGQAADAQDVVQETLIAAYEGLSRFEGRSSFKTWLLRILHHRCARMHRRRPPHSALPDGSGEPVEARQATGASDARIDLPTLLASLSFEHRQVIVLREVQRLSYQEIARLLEVPRGTVESRLHRARACLRQEFAEFLE